MFRKITYKDNYWIINNKSNNCKENLSWNKKRVFNIKRYSFYLGASSI